MNELLELELWRIISQGNDESGGGYSGGGRGSLVHKSYEEVIVVVGQDLAVVENLFQWSCKFLSNSVYKEIGAHDRGAHDRGARPCALILTRAFCGFLNWAHLCTRPCCTVVSFFVLFSHARVCRRTTVLF
ncbi:hypothetical protein GOBAR_AA14963 [Gossypium barbadense]|uniref:Uncharacterized protein n=1 Tax=Gossypium barbadense TaxID=3634 RepID=A0A2P5XQX5_GOSBA|nr:hypothetical protein GOBAR_AA14963 [Gossypium barbadense]